MGFRSESHIVLFLNYLNSHCTNISFTCEVVDDGFHRRFFYSKPTFTGLFTNFDIFIPFPFKRALYNNTDTLLDRYFEICSSYYYFHTGVAKRRTFLLNNCYPEAFIDRFTCTSLVFLLRLTLTTLTLLTL